MEEKTESISKFGNVDFEGTEIGKFVNLFLKCETKEDVDDLLGQYEKYCDTPAIARKNMGYIFGYANEEDRKKLYLMFPVTHPIFGQNF